MSDAVSEPKDESPPGGFVLQQRIRELEARVVELEAIAARSAGRLSFFGFFGRVCPSLGLLYLVSAVLQGVLGL